MKRRCAMYRLGLSFRMVRCGNPATFQARSRLAGGKKAWCCPGCLKMNARVLERIEEGKS